MAQSDSGSEAQVPSPNVWVDCACGQRHWGRYGAAGLLLVWRPDPRSEERPDPGPAPSPHPSPEPSPDPSPVPAVDEDRAEVLLQHRADWTHEGGTWALPGGARGHDETPEQAALREANEEAGLDAGLVTTGELVVVDHGPWSYTYVLAGTTTRAHLEPTDLETADLAWVPLAEVASYPLHPLFEQAWPGLSRRLARDG